MEKRMVSDARRMVNDLRRRWMRWTSDVASCCDVDLMGNSADLLLLLLDISLFCMLSRVLLEIIGIVVVDAHLFVIRGED